MSVKHGMSSPKESVVKMYSLLPDEAVFHVIWAEEGRYAFAFLHLHVYVYLYLKAFALREYSHRFVLAFFHLSLLHSLSVPLPEDQNALDSFRS